MSAELDEFEQDEQPVEGQAEKAAADADAVELPDADLKGVAGAGIRDALNPDKDYYKKRLG